MRLAVLRQYSVCFSASLTQQHQSVHTGVQWCAPISEQVEASIARILVTVWLHRMPLACMYLDYPISCMYTVFLVITVFNYIDSTSVCKSTWQSPKAAGHELPVMMNGDQDKSGIESRWNGHTIGSVRRKSHHLSSGQVRRQLRLVLCFWLPRFWRLKIMNFVLW